MMKARMKRVESGTVLGGCHVAVPEGKGSLVVALLTRKGQALDSCISADSNRVEGPLKGDGRQIGRQLSGRFSVNKAALSACEEGLAGGDKQVGSSAASPNPTEICGKLCLSFR